MSATAGNRDGEGAWRWLIEWIHAGFRRRSQTPDEDSPASPLAAWLWLQTEDEAKARSGFHLVPLGLMAGIALVLAAGLRPGLALSLALLLSCPAAFRLLQESTVRRSALVVLASVAGGLFLAEAELARTHTTIFSGEATVRIFGRVEWREPDEKGRQRYVVSIERTERPTLSRPPDRARILVMSRHEPIPIGGRYEGLVRLRPPSGPALPGAYDFAFAPYFAGLGAYGFSLGAPAEQADDMPVGHGWGEGLARLRLAMAERIAGSIGGPEGAVAAALVTGVRAGIPEEIDEQLRVTGLAHVLSISGFHMALVAGFVMVAIRAILAAVPTIALRVPVKKIAALAALGVAGFYLMLAGENVATFRSFIMLGVMLGAVLIDQPALTLRNVSIAAIVVLAWTPHAMFTASFQMSFAATAALVGVYGAFSRWRSERAESRETGTSLRTGARVFTFLCGLVLVSIVAGAATAPFGAYHFGRLAPFGLAANTLLMPVFSFVIMPAALVGVLLMPLGLDGIAWMVAGQGLTFVFDVAGYLAEAFPDQAFGRMSAAALLAFTAAILAASFLASRLRWAALPLAAAGFALAAIRSGPPELLVFEDGKEVALVTAEGELIHLRAKPNRFVDEQWRRAFPQAHDPAMATAAVGKPTEAASALGQQAGDLAPAGFVCADDVCRATTRSGIRIAWTEDYEKTGLLCDTADIAIVSRAIRLNECRSGAHLVTLRTLRRTGSLSVGRTLSTRAPLVTASVPDLTESWNVHRSAPWPEYWRNPDTVDGPARTIPPPGDASSPPAGGLNSGGSGPPASPAP